MKDGRNRKDRMNCRGKEAWKGREKLRSKRRKKEYKNGKDKRDKWNLNVCRRKKKKRRKSKGRGRRRT
jgi:hypothetical protein